MKFSQSRFFSSLSLLLALVLSSSAAFADQLVLKSGREYSGKFIRGDASSVEFRTGGKIESFRTLDVAQIVFKEPELAPQPAGRGILAPAAQDPARAAQDQPPVRQVPPQPAAPSVT